MITRIALPAILLLASCGPSEPPSELVSSSRYVTRLDKDIAQYACPPDVQAVLNQPEPFRAAAAFVRGGQRLKEWTEGPIDPFVETPANLAPGIQSMRNAVGTIAHAFDRAAGVAANDERECFGERALSCDQRPRATNIFYNIDTRAIQNGFNEYLRQRGELARIFEKEGAPLPAAPACNNQVTRR